LRYIPALNASDKHVAFLCGLIEKNIAGWPEASSDWNLPDVTQALQESLNRAREMGAKS